MTDVESIPLDPTAEIEDHVITKADCNRNYEHLREAIADPNEGLFGPDSMLWQMLEPMPVLPHMLIMAGLLEGAVPKIWFGTEKSITREGDYVSRYARSYDAFASWFCGDLKSAVKMSRKVNGYHSRIGGYAPNDCGRVRAGQGYRACEQQLMILTLATQLFPIKDFYEILTRPLTRAEKDRYYEECKRFALLFGIAENAMPPDWDAFERYWLGCFESGELEIAREGHDRYGPFNDQSGLPFVAKWLTRWVMVVEFNLMPDSLRRQFEPVTSLAKQRPGVTAASLLLLKTLLRVLPQGLSASPRIQAARRRVGRIDKPGRLERWVANHVPHPFGERMPTLNTPASSLSDPRNSEALTLPSI